MVHRKQSARLLGLAALVLAALPARATPVTNEATFLAQLGADVSTVHFDAVAPGSDLSGASLGFANAAPHLLLQLPSTVTDFTGTSVGLRAVGPNSPTSAPGSALGTDDPDNFGQFVAGTPLSFGLSVPVGAFGLSFISPDDLFDGDIRLRAGSGLADLVAADRRWVGDLGGIAYYAYFLGLLNVGAISSVVVDYGAAVAGGPFLYVIDDIRVAGVGEVPEPVTLALVGVALLGAVAASSRRRGPAQR